MERLFFIKLHCIIFTSMASKYKGKKALDSMTKKEVDEYKRYIIGNSEKFFQGTDDYRYFKEL